jgi:hypothetical protein
MMESSMGKIFAVFAQKSGIDRLFHVSPPRFFNVPSDRLIYLFDCVVSKGIYPVLSPDSREFKQL